MAGCAYWVHRWSALTNKSLRCIRCAAKERRAKERGSALPDCVPFSPFFHLVGEVAAIVPQPDDWVSSRMVIADNAQRSRAEKKMATGIRRQA